MASEMKPADLFSTPIALFDDVYANPQEIALAAIRAVGNTGTPGSWDCDISSSFGVDRQFANQLPAFKATILEAASQYSQKHWNKNAIMIESWANVAKTGQYQEQHDHIGETGTRFCAVYYPQVGEQEKISFHTPYKILSLLDPMKTIVAIKLKPNRLIVFPAYLEHSFKALQRDVNKVSVAFNFVLG
jgi:hypothetical protein